MRKNIKVFLCFFICIMIWLFTGVTVNAEENSDNLGSYEYFTYHRQDFGDGRVFDVKNVYFSSYPLYIIHNKDLASISGFQHLEYRITNSVDFNNDFSSDYYFRYTRYMKILEEGKNDFISEPVDFDVYADSFVPIYGSNNPFIPLGFDTDIPIFDVNDLDSIRAYIDEGDITGAENYDDLSKNKNDGSVPVPTGLFGSGSYKYDDVWNNRFSDSLLSVSWPVTEDYRKFTFDVQLSFDYRKGSNNYNNTGWVDLLSNENYEDADAISYDIVNKVIGRNCLNDLLFSCFSSDRLQIDKAIDEVPIVFVRVRNRDGNKISNWVKITFTSTGKAYVDETNENDERVDSDEYDSTDTNPSNKDDGGGSSNFPDINDYPTFTSDSISGLFSFIRSGFGLLGGGGLVSLMSQTFLYIPASVWDLVKTSISVSIVIMVIALIKKFVFG